MTRPGYGEYRTAKMTSGVDVQSVWRTRGRVAAGNANRSRPAPATPADEPGTADDPLLTIDEVTAELRVSRATFYR